MLQYKRKKKSGIGITSQHAKLFNNFQIIINIRKSIKSNWFFP